LVVEQQEVKVKYTLKKRRKNTSEKSSCCEPELNQSCCGPISQSANVEEIVKKSYGQRWASQKAGKSAESKELASLFSAHEVLLEELRLREGMRVLDIGSGNGETVLTIAEKVKPTGKAVGIDFSPEGIALSTEKAKKRKLDNVAEFHQANAMELPFPDNSFDAVISECVVCLIQDKQKALDEKVRVLKPGGRVVMHDVVTWAPMPKAIKENSELYCECVGGAVSLNENIEMMKNAGLTNIKTIDFTSDTKKMMNIDAVEQTLDLEDENKVHEVVDFVRKGGLGYALLIGTKNQT
jgi:ubiquinone/menaquinone biosynthesis C-methylase UbiE